MDERQPMRYLSVCSGIEAATMAWHDLGWTPAGFSEIEPFPSAVLAHHYPNVTNFGDMTKYKEWNLDGSIDLLVGGTPCQSFSVAGLRKGMDDPRGNLALVYCGMLDHFRPNWFVWENVPGVLSSSGGRDFGSFLGAVAQLGYGFAYRVLDAQFCGVAQRRRRVFVVGYLGDWRPAAAVLFERHSLRWDLAPSAPQGKEPTAYFESSLAQYREGDIGGTLKASGGVLGGGSETFIAHPVDVPDVMATLLSSTAGISRPGNAVTEHITYIPMSNKKVRRLTPKECERLQGFPDNFTNVPWRKKDTAPDGPRYKALGNSMAVPCMQWIGDGIDLVDKL
jgi:DNA (cytosine-5)-methyltransferase 1